MSNQNDEKNAAKKTTDVGVWIIYGLLGGMLVGTATGHLTLWMGIGMCLGVLFGAIKSMNKR